MAYVNLWELITTVSSSKHDLPRRAECEEIKNKIGPRFGGELSLDIDDHGRWVVKVFNYTDSTQFVEMAINPDGFTRVTRGRSSGDIYEERTISF